MSSISLSAEAVSALRQLAETTEIRDAAGQIVGVFVPRSLAQSRSAMGFDLDETERILATEKDKGRSLKDIWQDLHAQKGSA
jgi:hypothetical protein